MSLRIDSADGAERDRGLEVAASAAAPRATSSCCRPTRSTASLPTRSRRRGVAALREAKGRGRDVPLPVLVGARDTIEGLAYGLSKAARDLVEAFWPGPLTLVRHAAAEPRLGPRRRERHGRGADAAAPGGLALLAATGPLAVTSANRPACRAGDDLADAEAQLGDAVAVYLDAGTVRARPSRARSSTSPGAVPRVVRVGAIDVDTAAHASCPHRARRRGARTA